MNNEYNNVLLLDHCTLFFQIDLYYLFAQNKEWEPEYQFYSLLFTLSNRS